MARTTKKLIDFENPERGIVTQDVAQNLNGLLSPQPFYRTLNGVSRRAEQVMTWQLPSGQAIQMYLNPQNFVVSDSKQIAETRTKGGFVIQYWGENLSQLSISGTTGSSGVKGINVLRDIYRSENRAFDLIAKQQLQDIDYVRTSVEAPGTLAGQLKDASKRIRERNFLLRPSLASLAASVVLFYQGIQYRGFFKDFSVTEGVQDLGLFNYQMSFVATDVRGQRKNFMPWHKEPLADDAAGQLINGIGNSLRKTVGLNPQPPEAFYPANAPYTFGGTSISGLAGIQSSATVSGQINNSSDDIFI